MKELRRPRGICRLKEAETWGGQTVYLSVSTSLLNASQLRNEIQRREIRNEEHEGTVGDAEGGKREERVEEKNSWKIMEGEEEEKQRAEGGALMNNPSVNI